MPTPAARSGLIRWVRRIVITASVLFLLVLAGGGLSYLRWGWHRLTPLDTPHNTAISGEFLPYQDHGLVFDGRSPLVLRIDHSGSGGSLLFFGSLHTGDPDDPQIERITEAWDSFGPTLGLCESRLGLYIGGPRAGIRQFGEPSLVYSLARRDGVEVGTLEPSWEDEIEAVLQSQDKQDAAAFYFLRVFLGETRGASPARAENLAKHLLAKRTKRPGLEGSFGSIDEFDTWWNQRHAGLGPWRTLNEETLWPRDKPTNPLGAVASASNRARDTHIAMLIVDRVRSGERVFAVCGASHAATLKPVLEQSLTPMP